MPLAAKTNLMFVTVLVAISVIPSATLVAAEINDSEERFDSPRLAQLAKDLNAGDATALDSFWRELHGHAPLVEAIAAEPHTARVTFVWRGNDDTRRVNLLGGLASGEPNK